MFTKPESGWTFLEIGDFSERASYLTDIPNDCLDAFIYALQNNTPIVIYFDAEGWEYYLVCSWCQAYIILNKEKHEIITIDKNIREIAKEFIKDIEENIDEWANWECYDDKDDNQIEEIKSELKEKLLKLKTLI